MNRYRILISFALLVGIALGDPTVGFFPSRHSCVAPLVALIRRQNLPDPYGLKPGDYRYEIRQQLRQLIRDPQLRKALRDAIYTDLYRRSDALSAELDAAQRTGRRNRAAQVYDVLFIGAGLHDAIGQMALNEKYPGLKTITVEGGDRVARNFDTDEFRLNSINGTDHVEDPALPATGRDLSALPGGVVQVSDFSSDSFPVARDLADATLINRATVRAPILFGHRVAKIEDRHAMPGSPRWPARYRITFENGHELFSNAVVATTGLGTDIRMPFPEKTAQWLRQARAEGKGVYTTEEYFKKVASDPELAAALADEDVAVIGAGDSGNTSIESLCRRGAKKVFWFGQKHGTADAFRQSEPKRYHEIAGFLGGRVEAVTPHAIDVQPLPDGRFRVVYGPGPGDYKDVRRVVIATGPENNVHQIFPWLKDQDFGRGGLPASNAVEPVTGTVAGVDGSANLGLRLKPNGDVPPHQIYLFGAAAGNLIRPEEKALAPAADPPSIFLTGKRTREGVLAVAGDWKPARLPRPAPVVPPLAKTLADGVRRAPAEPLPGMSAMVQRFYDRQRADGARFEPEHFDVSEMRPVLDWASEKLRKRIDELSAHSPPPPELDALKTLLARVEAQKKEGLTYGTLLDLTDKTSLALSLGEGVSSLGAEDLRRLTDFSPAGRSETVNEILRAKHALFLPAHATLLADHFNSVRGLPVYFVGLASRRLRVDGDVLTPREFFLHDLQHALAMRNRTDAALLGSADHPAYLRELDRRERFNRRFLERAGAIADPEVAAAVRLLWFSVTRDGPYLLKSFGPHGLRDYFITDQEAVRALLLRKYKEGIYDYEPLYLGKDPAATLRKAEDWLRAFAAETPGTLAEPALPKPSSPFRQQSFAPGRLETTLGIPHAPPAGRRPGEPAWADLSENPRLRGLFPQATHISAVYGDEGCSGFFVYTPEQGARYFNLGGAQPSEKEMGTLITAYRDFIKAKVPDPKVHSQPLALQGVQDVGRGEVTPFLSVPGVFAHAPQDYSAHHGRTLLNAVLDRVTASDKKVLVVGSGTGREAIALAGRHPSMQVTASDIAPEATAVGRANAELHGAKKNIDFVTSDLFDKTPGTYDIIVFNAPRPMRADLIDPSHMDPVAAQKHIDDLKKAGPSATSDPEGEILKRTLATVGPHMHAGTRFFLMSDSKIAPLVPPGFTVTPITAPQGWHPWKWPNEQFVIYEIRKKP